MCAVCGVHVDLTLNSALDAVEDKGWPWVHSEIDDE